MMNKSVMKTISNLAVGAAAQVCKMPEQKCMFFCGKPQPRTELAYKDYEDLYRYLKNKS